jgi:hypothetical protein
VSTILALSSEDREDMVTRHQLGHTLSDALNNAVRKTLFVKMLLQKLNYEEQAKFSSECKKRVHLYSFVEHFSGVFFLLAVCIHDISTRLRHYVVAEGGCN